MTIQNILKRGSITKNVEKLDRLKETAFLEYAQNDAVKNLLLIQTEEGKFVFVTKLTWKESYCVVETARGIIKEWADLERLASHVENNYPTLPSIEIIFNAGFAKSLMGRIKNIQSVRFDTELIT